MSTGVPTPPRRSVAAHVEAAAAGQHDVEHDQVEAPRHRPAQPRLAVGRRLHLVALAREAVGEQEPQPGVVLDEQDAVAQG